MKNRNKLVTNCSLACLSKYMNSRISNSNINCILHSVSYVDSWFGPELFITFVIGNKRFGINIIKLKYHTLRYVYDYCKYKLEIEIKRISKWKIEI